MRKTSDELRLTFIEFFKERGHPHLPQAPLVPHDDPEHQSHRWNQKCGRRGARRADTPGGDRE